MGVKTDVDRPQAQEIVARVAQLRPWLREHQAVAEQQRRIPQETIERLDAVGVFWDACSAAIETLFRASGASAIVKRHPLQLIARNCLAGNLHAALNIDTWMENLGLAVCGVESGPASMSVLERRS